MSDDDDYWRRLMREIRGYLDASGVNAERARYVAKHGAWAEVHVPVWTRP